MTEVVDAEAEVWAATWVPGPSPVEGFGDASGYAVAWVQVPGGPRLQALVEGSGVPECGAAGRARTREVAEERICVFVPGEAGRA